MPDEAHPYTTALPRLSWQPMPGWAGHIRLTTEAGALVTSALAGCAVGDRIKWEVAVQLVPTPTGPRPMVLLYLSMPSAVLGELCGEVVLVEPQQATAENVDRQVRAVVERLRAARSASVSTSQG